MSEIKALLFDFGGTLDNDGVDWFSRLYQGITSRCAGLDREVFQKYAEQAANALSDFSDTGTLTMAETVQRLTRLIHEKMAEADVCEANAWDADDVAEEFVIHASRFLQRNHEVLKKLGDRFRLGCISNNWGNTTGWCAQYQLNDLFEVMVDSERVGVMKPDGLIFQTALDQMKLPADQCVYVGDRFDCDVEGSQAAGMTAVWITNGRYYGRVDESVESRRIQKLPELLEMDW